MKKFLIILFLFINIGCYSQWKFKHGIKAGVTPIDSICFTGGVLNHYEGTTVNNKGRLPYGFILNGIQVDSISHPPNSWIWYQGTSSSGKPNMLYGMQVGGCATIDSVHVTAPNIDSLYSGGIGYPVNKFIYYADSGVDVGQSLWTITDITRNADTLWIEVNGTMLYKLIGDSDLVYTDYPLVTSPDPLHLAPYGLSVATPTTKTQYITEDTDTLKFNTGGWKFNIDKVVAAAPAYCAQYQAVYNAYSNPPGTDTAAVLNTFVQTLVTAGIWDKLVFVHFEAAKNVTDCKINWINPGTYNLTFSATAPTFAQWHGITGNGGGANNAVANTGFNPSTAGSKYIQDSASIGGYVLTDVDETKYLMGAGSSAPVAWIIASNAGGVSNVGINAGSANDKANSSGNGFFILVREGAAVTKLYQRGTQQGTTITTASTGLSNSNFYILSRNTGSSSTNTVAFDFAATELSSTEVATFNTALETVMDYFGTGVQP